jgi:TonB family protein
MFISVALHAVAAAYPAVFFARHPREAIPVVVLDAGEPGEEKSGDGRAEGKKGGQPANSRHFALAQRLAVTETEEKKPAADSHGSSEIALNSSDARGETAMASVFAAPGDGIGSFSTQSEYGSSSENRSSGEGDSGSGPGSGAESGDGHASSKFFQVGYAYSPKPRYPESARRDGKEGRVILRVLVDERGRSKSVEVNLSSGSQALDQAAAKVMKRWRFSPARSGDTPVESWVKIPIDFQLTDAK